MADIVLKDRDGNGVTYEGVTALRLNTADGGTQIFSAGEAIEGIEIALDFSEGDQPITAPDGTLVKSAVIKKPETLLPENIAKDVDIAGVVGTMEAGGGDACILPCVWMQAYAPISASYTSSSTNVSRTVSFSLPLNSTIYAMYFINNYASGSSSSYSRSNQNLFVVSPTISSSDTSMTVSYTHSMYAYKYYSHAPVAVLMFGISGLYAVKKADGTFDIVADESCAALCAYSRLCCYPTIDTVDMSAATFTTVPNSALRYLNANRIIMPATVTSIASYGLSSDYVTEIDFCRHTFVPTMSSSSSIRIGTIIKIPAALYDEWIAATSWSSHADYIVAV